MSGFELSHVVFFNVHFNLCDIQATWTYPWCRARLQQRSDVPLRVCFYLTERRSPSTHLYFGFTLAPKEKNSFKRG